MAQPKPQHDRPPSLTEFGIHVCAWASPAATRTWPCYMAGCTLQRTRNSCEQRTASGAGTRCKVTISQHVSALLPRTAFCLTARQETVAKETAESAGRGWTEQRMPSEEYLPACQSSRLVSTKMTVNVNVRPSPWQLLILNDYHRCRHNFY